MTQLSEDALAAEVQALRAQIAEDHPEPARLFDAVQRVIGQLEAAGATVPADLREFADELEGEVVEEYYDNMPV